MRVVAVIVDENPCGAAFAQDTEDFFDAAGWIGPVVSRLDGDRAIEEIRFPGNAFNAADDEHGVVALDAPSRRKYPFRRRGPREPARKGAARASPLRSRHQAHSRLAPCASGRER